MNMSSPLQSRLLLPFESSDDELIRLRMNLAELEGEAIKKDQLLSQLMCRMREYEMGEYGLAEAVNEIKECKKVIRARDREIEKLADEINFLKLQIPVELELNEDTKEKEKLHTFVSTNTLLKDGRPSVCSEEVKMENTCKVPGEDKSCQCQILIYPSKYTEDMYASKFQNENLRSELSTVCRNAIDSIGYLQKNNQQCQLKNDRFIKKLQDHLLTLQATTIGDRVSNHYQPNSTENRIEKSANKGTTQLLSAEDSHFILQLAENWKLCKQPFCKDMVFKLVELEMKLLNEILLQKKLLEIAHHQTQELEAMYCTQEVLVKSLRSQLVFFQEKRDERVLIGKLAMKVLQLQFSQAAYLFELEKLKSSKESAKNILDI